MCVKIKQSLFKQIITLTPEQISNTVKENHHHHFLMKLSKQKFWTAAWNGAVWIFTNGIPDAIIIIGEVLSDPGPTRNLHNSQVLLQVHRIHILFNTCNRGKKKNYPWFIIVLVGLYFLLLGTWFQDLMHAYISVNLITWFSSVSPFGKQYGTTSSLFFTFKELTKR